VRKIYKMLRMNMMKDKLNKIKIIRMIERRVKGNNKEMIKTTNKNNKKKHNKINKRANKKRNKVNSRANKISNRMRKENRLTYNKVIRMANE